MCNFERDNFTTDRQELSNSPNLLFDDKTKGTRIHAHGALPAHYEGVCVHNCSFYGRVEPESNSAQSNERLPQSGCP